MRTSIVLFFWLHLWAYCEAAPPHYSVTDIGPAPSEQNVFINNHGQVAASYFTGQIITAGDQGLPRFLWVRGKRIFLRLPPAYNSTIVCGINNHGQIAGNLDATYDGPLTIVSHAFLWQQGKMQDLGAPDGDKVSEARAINDKGEIVGRAYTSGRPVEDDASLTEHHAFVYRNGQFTDLGLGEADAINSKGQIAGEVPDGVSFHAALWNKGKRVDLGIQGSVHAINDKEQVLIKTGNTHPILWQNWRVKFLPLLSRAADTSAVGLNNNGQIVGYAWSEQNHWSAQKQRALLWQHGSVYNLNTLISPRSGWVLSAATGINNKGQIVGYGLFHSASHAFLLTPAAR